MDRAPLEEVMRDFRGESGKIIGHSSRGRSSVRKVVYNPGMGSLAPAGALKERRKAAGLSQEEVAQLARCSLNTVRNYENGLAPKASAALSRIELALAHIEKGAS